MNRLLDRTSFAALGTTCTVAVSTSPLELPAARRAALAMRAEVEACERALSRFDAAADLGRANAAAGTWVDVDARLIEALVVALRLRAATSGRCDPTLLPALEAVGYDRSYESLIERPLQAAPPAAGEVEIDPGRRRIRVPRRGAVDLGATGKGFIARRALAAGAQAWPLLPGACIDLGGDLAVTGSPPDGDAWVVDVEDPSAPTAVLGTLRVRAGGVATSGPARRRFGPAGSLHHLIDPGTRAPAVDGPLAATVVAADPAAADAHATALAVTPVAEAAGYVAARTGLGAVLALADRPALALGEIDFMPVSTREAAL